MQDPDSPDDRLIRFLLARSGVRGVLVRLQATWQHIRAREAYPDSLAQLLGQTTVAAALFTGHIKVDGRLAIQLKGSGALRTLFADCHSDGALRGIALWQPPLPEPLALAELGRHAIMAITIERAPGRSGETQRYQGLVPLSGATLSQAFESYFDRSEQLPTRVLLAADSHQACGLLLQQLPGESLDIDGWPRAQALFDTLHGDELLRTDPELLLHRLFHEDAPELLSQKPLRFACSCSRQRVGDMLLSLGRDEAEAALAGNAGTLEVSCEFCAQKYRFDAVDLSLLFAGGGSESLSGPAH